MQLKIARCLGRYLLALVVCCCWSAGVTGQVVEALTVENGLSQGFVPGLIQGSDGFMWIATLDGLNRYDGVEVKVFREISGGPYSLPSNVVLGVHEDVRRRLWVTTEEGIGVFDRTTFRYYHVWAPPLTGQSAALATPKLLVEDPQGRFWCSYSNKFYCLAWPSADIPLPDLAARLSVTAYEIPTDVRINVISLATIDSALWIGTNQGIYVKSLTDMQAGPVLLQEPQQVALAMWQDSSGIWVQSWRSVTLYRPGKGSTVFPTEPSGERRNLRGVFSRGKTYIFTQKRVYCWDGTGFTSLPLIISEEIQSACLDRHGRLWIGTNARGVRSFSPGQFQFPVLAQGLSQRSPAIFDEAGQLWLYRHEQRPIGYRRYSPSADALGELLFPEGHECAIPARGGGLWVLTVYGQLVRQYRDGRQQRWQWTDYAALEYPRTLLEDHTGRLWVRVKGVVLRGIDTATNRFFDVDFSYLFTDSKVTPQIHVLAEDAQGRLWLGTNAGLIRVEWQADGQHSARLYHDRSDAAARLSSTRIQALLPDPSDPDVLWIGTQRGLNRLHVPSGNVRYLTEQDGLASDAIATLQTAPGQQLLWIGTNNGLIELETDTWQWRRFTTAHGLPAAEFNRNAAAIAPDGRLLFGGVEGLIVVDPKAHSRSRQQPTIRLTALAVNNQPIEPGDSSGILQVAIEYTDQIVLLPGQNSLLFTFALLDYRYAAGNRYEYKLNDIDSAWVSLGTRRRANFINLNPGTYELYVRGCNFDGVWSEPVRLKIVVRAPWWQRWWALAGYFALAIVLIALGVRIRIREVRLQYQFELEHGEAIRLKELDQFKSRVFANVTHEFRTPLTVMLGMAEQIERKTTGEVHERAALISHNGAALLRLTNQLLDLARLDARRLELAAEPGELGGYLRMVGEVLQPLAEAKKIEFQVEVPAEPVWTRFDPQRLRDIVNNLVSNAVKFTPTGGTVLVRLGIVDERELCLSVSDSGIGIPAELHERIFERFFQAGNNSLPGGSGIGLAYVRELVALMNGTIEVSSEPGLGSTFTVRWPYEAAEPIVDLPASRLPAIPLQANAPAWTEAEPDSAALPLVLLIEDHADIAYYVADCLAGSYAVEIQADGHAGVQKALEVVPDLVITDLMLPGLDGYAVCATLKHDLRTSHVPVVMLTARNDDTSRLEGLRRGADVYLTKPFRRDELLIQLQNLLRHTSQRREHYRGVAEQDQAAPPAEVVSEEVQAEETFVRQVLAIVEQHYQDPEFGVTDIQRAMAMSSSQLHRKLTALTGKPAGFYLRQIRLERARQDLVELRDLSVAVIAMRNGFRDPNYFSRVFAQEYGQSPSDFRQEMADVTIK